MGPIGRDYDDVINDTIKLSPGVDFCVNRPCLNGGTCIPTSGGYACQCLPGYTDSNCQTRMYCTIYYYAFVFIH